MNSEFTTMLLTCDKNADVLPYFFIFFMRAWPDFKSPFFVNIESIRNLDTPISVKYPSKVYKWDDPWSGRLLDCLKEIDTKYVLLIMDDFFLTDKVDIKEIDRCISSLNNYPDIACFNFAFSNSPYEKKGFDRYVLVSKKAPFRMNLQAALWRKDTLIKYIRKHENPWQFEIWGSKRIRRYNDRIYHLDKHAKKIFSYPVGGVLADGKWRTDESVSLLKANGIDIDFSVRGIYYPGDPRKTEITHRSFLQKCWQVFKSLR